MDNKEIIKRLRIIYDNSTLGDIPAIVEELELRNKRIDSAEQIKELFGLAWYSAGDKNTIEEELQTLLDSMIQST